MLIINQSLLNILFSYFYIDVTGRPETAYTGYQYGSILKVHWNLPNLTKSKTHRQGDSSTDDLLQVSEKYRLAF